MKSIIMKKVLAVLMTVAIAASLAGCKTEEKPAEETGKPTVGAEKTTPSGNESSGNETAQNTTPDPVDETDEIGLYTLLKDENGNVYDLGGVEVIIRDWWTEDKEPEISNAYDEARQEYLEWIQETYNFKVKRVAVSTWGSTPEDFVNYATTGGDEYYLFTLRSGGELVSAMNQGLMYDLSTLDCLDFSESKWAGVHEMMNKGGSIYGMYGELPEPKGGMYFNKRVLEEAGINPDDIYTLQENMEWTWEKFEELCEKVQADTDNDGVIDRFAMASFTSCFYPFAVYSNGGEYIGLDSSGKYYNNLESEATIEALNWALDMIDRYDELNYYPEDANWDYWLTAYMNGEAAFMADEVYRAGQMGEMEDEFGFVCFPMGPKAKDYTNCWSDNPIVIPACYDAEKAWKCAFVYDLWTEPVPGFEDYDGWKSSYYKSFRDTESVDLSIQRMLYNGFTTYHLMVAGVDLGPDLHWGLSKENTPAQQAESIRNTWAAYLSEANGD